jgi:hypothetical protein
MILHLGQQRVLMVRKNVFILFCVWVLLPLTGMACSCATPVPGFSECYQNADLVAFVRVSDYVQFQKSSYSNDSIPVALEADIIYTHLGEAAKRRIKIYGGNGGNCPHIIAKSLLKNRYLLVGVFKTGNGYVFGGCGIYCLNMTVWVYLFYAIVAILLYILFRAIKKRRHTVTKTDD